MSWEREGIALLSASLVRPLGLAAVAWLILRVARVRHPASRHAIWTAVLAGMLLLPAASALAPRWNLPLLPAKRGAATTAVPPASGVAIAADPSASIAAESAIDGAPGSQRSGSAWPSLQTSLLWLYVAGVLAVATYRLIGWALLRQVLSRSTPVRGGWLRESADIVTPVAVGVLRPAALLPAGWRTWSASTRRAVLAHEFAHLRRRDSLIAGAAHLAQCVFWFHPLAWWLSRHISDLAELCCDAAALERVNDAAGYSRILLEFADRVQRAGRRVALPGLAMAAGSNMGRRIDEVFELSGGTLRRLSRPGAVLGLIGVPAMALSATLALSQANPPSPAARPLPVPAVVAQTAAAPPPAPKPEAAPQPASPKPPAAEFEVASVKPCKDAISGGRGGGRRGGGPGSFSPDRLDLPCQPVMNLIRTAYFRFAGGRFHSLPEDEPVDGAPGWLSSERYTIDAKASGPVGQETMRGPMLQALLEDRFQLKAHRETREAPVYVLSVAKGGPKMPRFEPGSCVPFDPSTLTFPPTPRTLAPGQKGCRTSLEPSGPNLLVNVEGMSVDQLFRMFLGMALDRPVVNKTGLVGLYNYRLEFAIDENTPGLRIGGGRGGSPDGDAASAASDQPAAPSIFTALQEQLGLKLEQAKGPREFLVIDHIERPAEN